MGHLHTSLVLLLLFCSPCAGKTFFTYLRTKCIDDCKPDGGEYKCKSIDKDGKCQEMYCSPQENLDYWGRECGEDKMFPSKCGKHGQDYYWCRINPFRWGYCGLVMEDTNHYGSKTGALCYDHCDQRNQYYYWCNTAEGWDYCSPSENTDYNNKQCVDNSPCGKQGQEYRCWLKEGRWSYCGLVEPKMFLHLSMYHYSCIDECQYYESGDYYWCHTANSWDYCSPNVDVTYKGKPCRSDDSCGLHDNSYNWCWTSTSDYDYCGPIESGECPSLLSTSQHRKKRAPSDKTLICTLVEDKHNKIISTLTAVPAPKNIADGSRWSNDAENLISRWNNGYLVDQARSNLIHSDDLRIDMQGTFNRNNQRYYNLQIQVNTNRRRGQSTTVSQVIVPDGVPEEHIRRAFRESLQRRARILVEVLTPNQCSL